ncbi:SRPBCC family protein [Janibacter anophelis]|uniref:SRPBCC family protein n=1 Tax=Janibacter anophelis TaxID=319054 RepID=UPI00082BCCED|nr:SRPBCC family protein [Janibacter anophelis]
MTETRVVRATAVVDAPASVVFEQIADPAAQIAWDGNDNLAAADDGQRVHAVGDVFVTTLTKDGARRRNLVVDFEEGRRIAWRPAPLDGEEPGHEWRWELRPLADGRTEVTHTYDWRELTDERRLARARRTTRDRLEASLERLADVCR